MVVELVVRDLAERARDEGAAAMVGALEDVLGEDEVDDLVGQASTGLQERACRSARHPGRV